MSGVAWGKLTAPDEEYLKAAVARLLPEYYSGDAAADDDGKVLRRMADEFEARHGDTWLRDVLKTPHSRRAADAFGALRRAVEAETRDWTKSSTEADMAGRLFRSAGSEAGALRAEFERVQALQVLYRYEQCASAGQELGRALGGRSYSWLRTQTLLESTICERPKIDFERAWTRYRAAIQMAKENRYSVLLLRALGLSAMWQTDIGSATVAWREYMQGLALYWTAKYPVIRGQFFYAELSWLPQLNTPYSAVAWARENVEITSSLELPSYYAGALHLLALDEMSAGLREKAMAHLQEVSRVTATLPSNEQRRLVSMYATIDLAEMEANLGGVDEPLARLVNLQQQVEGGEALLRLRFDATLGRLRLRHGEYAEAERLLQRALGIGNTARVTLSEDQRLSWEHSLGDTYRALVECEIRRGADPRESWALWSRYRAALFDGDLGPSSGRDAVAPGEAMLSFAELPSGVGAWLATPHGFHFRWLDTQTKIVREAASRLVRGCATDRSPESVLRGDARQLSQWLLGPWESELNGVRVVVIESDGPVASLPWPALVRSNGHYWSEDFAVRIRSGAGRRPEADAPLTAAESVLAVGESALAGSDLPPLPEARREAEKVSSLFPRSVLLVGQHATLTEIRKRLESAEVFHFAGHGYGGEGGGLILRGAAGGPAMLRASDIRDLHLSRCRLAVLSGCSTGSGELNGPGDPQSLVRAFLCAGTREVVAGFWNLSSEGTQVFIREFYAAILSGAPADEALRAAAARVRTLSEYRHPYYWAGLQLFSVQ
jgi:CHAT domain-containing protein